MLKFIVSIIFLATAMAIFFTWSQPVFNEIKDLQAQRVAFDEALSKSRQIQETRDDLLSQYNAISQENIERLNKILPSQPGSIKFIIEIDNILRQNGMLLKNIDIKEKDEDKEKISFGAPEHSFKTLPLSMRVAGPYKSFYAFLKDLEKNLRLTDITALNFSSSNVDFYEYNIEAIIYYE
jgi:Tfp pilus assembly protein PilO